MNEKFFHESIFTKSSFNDFKDDYSPLKLKSTKHFELTSSNTNSANKSKKESSKKSTIKSNIVPKSNKIILTNQFQNKLPESKPQITLK